MSHRTCSTALLWMVAWLVPALLAGCASVGLSSPATTQAAAPESLSMPLHAPLPGIYTSGQPAVGDWRALFRRGVATVIDLRLPEETPDRDEAAEVAAAGLVYLTLPVRGADGLTADKARALSALLQANAGPVLVHCASGNRAGGLLALMLAQQGMAPQQALAVGREAGMRSTESRVRELLRLSPAHGD